MAFAAGRVLAGKAEKTDHKPCIKSDTNHPAFDRQFQVTVVKQIALGMEGADSLFNFRLNVGLASPAEDGFFRKHLPSRLIHLQSEIDGGTVPQAIAQGSCIAVIDQQTAQCDRCHYKNRQRRTAHSAIGAETREQNNRKPGGEPHPRVRVASNASGTVTQSIAANIPGNTVRRKESSAINPRMFRQTPFATACKKGPRARSA